MARRLVHGVGFYGSDEEFARTFTPFCEAGVAAGEPTLVRLGKRKTDLLRAELRDPDAVVFLSGEEDYRHPPGALASALGIARGHGRGGSRPIRILGEIPALVGLSEDAWLRYEAAANRALGGFPLRTLCAFDTRLTSRGARAELLRTHHVLHTADGGQEPIAGYEEPETFVRTRGYVVRDPLEDGAPALELVDPRPEAARRALVALTRAMRLDAAAGHDLLVAVNEVLTNALTHGRRPVGLRAWGRPGRVVVAVRDAGTGPESLLVGLIPAAPGEREGGRGLPITHRLCRETALSVDDDGFTVRLAAGTAGRGDGQADGQAG